MFLLLHVILREATYKGIKLWQILLKMCISRTKIQSYKLKLNKCSKYKLRNDISVLYKYVHIADVLSSSP